jgi:hypothetical protein
MCPKTIVRLTKKLVDGQSRGAELGISSQLSGEYPPNKILLIIQCTNVVEAD